ncbi:hypothetical protein LCGC14_2606670 [marine sediment metagenome]|uniref:Uncharacterized protein n=1 Tax=marine sediment metagenome TaxID=412755 RepID=A0A0F9AUT8_9ZZZZ
MKTSDVLRTHLEIYNCCGWPPESYATCSDCFNRLVLLAKREVVHMQLDFGNGDSDHQVYSQGRYTGYTTG